MGEGKLYIRSQKEAERREESKENRGNWEEDSQKKDMSSRAKRGN